MVLVAFVTLGAGCRGMTSSQPPIHPNPNMFHQPKARAQSESDFFYDGASMRPPVPGTVARGELREDRAFFEGKDPEGKDLVHSPVAASAALVERGAERFRIYCRPCHDARGDGKGVLSERGKVPTTSLHDPKAVNAVDGHLFDVITNGLGLMPAYRWPIPPADRWAIIAYVRELQQQRQAQALPPKDDPPYGGGAPSPAGGAR